MRKHAATNRKTSIRYGAQALWPQEAMMSQGPCDRLSAMARPGLVGVVSIRTSLAGALIADDGSVPPIKPDEHLPSVRFLRVAADRIEL